MKKKGFKTAFIIIVTIVAFVLIGMVAILLSGNQITVARCIVSDNESLYMVYDERPVKLNNEKETNYQTGDKLLIVHQSAFAESYPEQTRAYLIIKIGNGSEDDIPQGAFDVLIETGNMTTD